MARRRWRSELAELRRDTQSGAAELELSALRVLQDAISESVPEDLASHKRWLVRLGRQILAAQPSMASIFRLVNDMLWYVRDARSGAETRNWALHFLDERRDRAREAQEALSVRAARLLAPYHTIMTYSRSSTVLGVLQRMAESDGDVRVICSESRPGLEGQSLAFELGSAGIRVTLGIDMALFGWLADADVLAVGADSISTAGVVNKVGTRELFKAAQELEIPRVVLATTAKFLPESYFAALGLRDGDPDEIMPGTENVTVRNPYFGLVPLELVSYVIGEDARLEPSDLVERLERLRIYPGLLGRQEE